MYFKLTWISDTGTETDIDVLDPGELKVACDDQEIDTSSWYGKANSFVYHRGPEPSYGYFLVDAKAAKNLLKRIHVSHPNEGQVGVRPGIRLVNLLIEMDDLGDNNEYETKVFEKLLVLSVENITPSYGGDESIYLVMVASTNCYIKGSVNGFPTPTPIRYSFDWINRRTKYISAEILQEVYNIQSQTTGVYEYERSSVEDAFGVTTNHPDIVGISSSESFPGPLSWKKVIEKLILLKFGGYVSENSGQGFFPVTCPGDSYQLDDTGVTYPTWLPSDIYTAEQDDCWVALKGILYVLNCNLIYKGKGKFKLEEIEDIHDFPNEADWWRDTTKALELKMEFDLILGKWTTDNVNADASYKVTDKMFLPVTDQANGPNDFIICHMFNVEDSARDDITFSTFDGTLSDSPEFDENGAAIKPSNDIESARIESFFSWPLLRNNGTWNIGGSIPPPIKPTIHTELHIRFPYGITVEEAGNYGPLGPTEDPAVVFQYMQQRFSPGKYKREWLFPRKVYTFSPFIDPEKENSHNNGKVIAERISWFITDIEAGTLVENILPPKQEDYYKKSNIVLFPVPDPIYVRVELNHEGENGEEEQFTITGDDFVLTQTNTEGEEEPIPIEPQGGDDFDFQEGDPKVVVFNKGLGGELNKKWDYNDFANLLPRLRGISGYNTDEDTFLGTSTTSPGIVWKEVVGGGGPGGGTTAAQITQIFQELSGDQINIIRNIVGDDVLIYKAEVNAPRTADETVPFGSTTEIIGGNPPTTGVALNRFNSPFLQGEKVLILEDPTGGISPTIVKIQPNILRANVVDDVAPDELVYSFDNAVSILGPVPPGGNGVAFNRLGSSIQEGKEVIIFLDKNGNWITLATPLSEVTGGEFKTFLGKVTEAITGATLIHGTSSDDPTRLELGVGYVREFKFIDPEWNPYLAPNGTANAPGVITPPALILTRLADFPLEDNPLFPEPPFVHVVYNMVEEEIKLGRIVQVKRIPVVIKPNEVPPQYANLLVVDVEGCP